MLDRLLSPPVVRRRTAAVAVLLGTWAVTCVGPAALAGDTAVGTGSVGDCGTLSFSGSAFGYLDNGTLSAGFCVSGTRSLRRINVAYDKAKGAPTAVRLGYQRTDSSGVGIRKPVYGSTVTARAGGTTLRSFSLPVSPGCYHGVMLNTATRFQYVTKVWGDC
ncbi:hypothetical protein [Streptosporangium saharense]|uniref:Uncharacterized protein n=1 Tax=Streptosporangium saharense TaxID=1706840 RepID=A0A7W7VNA2_9ACTN|nr:hypothetical protein [Streptosporangium saharense]MBB4916289.1 hypothetical protein [Streptosporangium saharense]